MTASAVDRVCRGGGVVASWVYDVEYDVSVEYGGSVEYDGSVEYGGSEEYDGSVEYDVVVVCTKITKDKEKRYLKISTRVITYRPTIQQVGANYTWTYRNI